MPRHMTFQDLLGVHLDDNYVWTGGTRPWRGFTSEEMADLLRQASKPTDAGRLRELQDENARLKRLEQIRELEAENEELRKRLGLTK